MNMAESFPRETVTSFKFSKMQIPSLKTYGATNLESYLMSRLTILRFMKYKQ